MIIDTGWVIIYQDSVVQPPIIPEPSVLTISSSRLSISPLKYSLSIQFAGYSLNRKKYSPLQNILSTTGRYSLGQLAH